MQRGTTLMPRGTTRSHNPVYFQEQVQRRATISITELKDGRFPTHTAAVLPLLPVDTTVAQESIRTYAGSTHATSPAMDLSGRSNIPFHAWVHEGRVGCGETPDSGENLQVKYKTASGSWTTFHTFQGGGAQTSNFHYSAVLPAAVSYTHLTLPTTERV